MVKLGCFFLAGLFSFTVWGQEPSLVKVDVVINGSGYGGRGVVVEHMRPVEGMPGFVVGRVLTAWHVISGDMNVIATAVTLTYTNGAICKTGRVVEYDAEYDLALVECVIPASIAPRKIGTSLPARGTVVTVFHQDGTASSPTLMRRYKDRLFLDGFVRSGDSGGPILNSEGEVIGVISGGWYAEEDKPDGFRYDDGTDAIDHWPVRAGLASRILEALKNATDHRAREGKL